MSFALALTRVLSRRACINPPRVAMPLSEKLDVPLQSYFLLLRACFIESSSSIREVKGCVLPQRLEARA